MLEIWLAFSTGLIGSTHCLGMCGGIVASLALAKRMEDSRARIVTQVMYNLGRILTYTLLGIVAGLIGPALDLLSLRSIALWFFVVANLFVILVGLSSALHFRRLSISSLESSAGKFLAVPLKRAAASSSPYAAFPLGFMLGMIPCGLVYGPLAVAGGSGSPLLGGAVMAALGLGTMPLMLVFGAASSTISGVMRDYLYRLTGLFMVLMGGAGLWRALAKMGYLSGGDNLLRFW
jgi:hypothetical protein